MGGRPGSRLEIHEPFCQSDTGSRERRVGGGKENPREGATMRTIDPMSAMERADELFHSGWNCAESVFVAVHEQAGEGDRALTRGRRRSPIQMCVDSALGFASDFTQ